jgi:hypothetical protein
MGLAQVIYPPPTAHGMTEWSFDHYQHHLAIIQQAAALGYTLNFYNIWPINEKNFKDFLDQHSQMHSEMNAIAGINGAELTDVDFKDKKKRDAWFYLQWVEHQSVAQFLGGGI